MGSLASEDAGSAVSLRAESPAKEHRTVSRVIAILERAAAESDGVRSTTLMRLLDAPKSSVHSLVKGLVATGYLVEVAGRYKLGPAVGALLVTARPTLLHAARPLMEALRGEFDETVMIAAAVGSSVVYIDGVESTHLIKYSAPLHIRRPMYPTSTGKVLLAHSSPRRLQSYLAEHFPDADQSLAIYEELVEVRSIGVAFNRGETAPDVYAAAAPIFAAGQVIGSIAVAGPTPRVRPRIDEIAAAVKRTASAITSKMY